MSQLPFSPLSQSTEVLCIAQAIVDVACRSSDEEIRSLGITKGAYQKVDYLFLQSLLTHLSGRELSILPGGSTANSLDIISSTGIKSSLVTGYGEDNFGKIFSSTYESKGVSLINVSNPDLHTGTSLILISPDGERSMSTYLGASEELNSGALIQVPIKPNTLLLIEGYVVRGGLGPDTVERLGELAKRVKAMCGNVVVALPPVQVINVLRREIRETLRFTDLLHGNAEEFLSLFEVKTLGEVEDALAQLNLGAVVTEGARGARAIFNRESVHVAAKDVEVVDLTGAGDAFLAGWLSGALQNVQVEAALIRGSTFAARVIGQQGARLTHCEIQRLLGK